MKPMKLVDSLKQLLSPTPQSAPDPVAAAAIALESLDQEIAAEQSVLDAMEAGHADTIVLALAAGNIKEVEQAEAAINARRQRIRSLHTARAAVAQRLDSARAAELAAASQDLHARVKAHADARRAALVRLEKLLGDVAAQVIIANESTAEMNRAVPALAQRWLQGMSPKGLEQAILARLAQLTDRMIEPKVHFTYDQLRSFPSPVNLHDQAIGIALQGLGPDNGGFDNAA